MTLEGVALSPADFGHFMASLIPDNDSQRTRPFSDREVETIQDLLLRTGKRSWSTRPRTYALLRVIGYVDLMQAFVVEGLTDNEFPYTRQTLPPDISSDRYACDSFLRRQHLVADTFGGGKDGDFKNGGKCFSWCHHCVRYQTQTHPFVQFLQYHLYPRAKLSNAKALSSSEKASNRS
jgi:hypothetical protein